MVSRRNGDRGWHVQACWYVPVVLPACACSFASWEGRSGNRRRSTASVSGSSPPERVMLQNAVIGPLRSRPVSSISSPFLLCPQRSGIMTACAPRALGPGPLSASKPSDAGSGLILPLVASAESTRGGCRPLVWTKGRWASVSHGYPRSKKGGEGRRPPEIAQVPVRGQMSRW